MPNNIDHKMLGGLSQTVQSSLPRIRAGIESFLEDPSQREALEEAYEDVHPIKDAAVMLDLSVLSQIASYVEEMIEAIATGSFSMDTTQAACLLNTVDHIVPYLESLLSEDGNERVIVTKVIQSYRRFKELPDGDDEVAVEQVMARQADDTPVEIQPAEMPEVKTSENEVVFPMDDTPIGPGDAEAVGREIVSQVDISSELLEGFLLEAEEYLDNISRFLPEIGDRPEQSEALLGVRRSVHTLKGAAGVVGLRSVSQLAHRMEDLLDELYDARLPLTSPAKDLLLATFDALDDFLRDKAAQGDFDQVAQPLYSSYAAVLGETPADASMHSDAFPAHSVVMSVDAESGVDHHPSPIAQPSAVVEEPLLKSQAPSPQEVTGSTVHQPADIIRVPLERLDELVRLVSELIISRSVYEQHLGRLSRQVEELHLSINRLQGITATIETQYEVSALVGNQKTPRHQAAISHPVVGAEAQITEFDALEFDRYSEFHLVSRELTENTADIGALGNELSDILGDFDSYLTRQSRLTSEIQDKLMQLRMVPLATLATRLHRAVRVTARERGKNAVFFLEGEEVEFDKTMLGEMADPLLHLLRNAVDHGIESPALRQELGKDPQGQIRLRAFREGTQLVIQVSDDGAGLDPQRLRSTAVHRGFVSEAEAAQLTNEQLYMLIFSPGFSTAQEVSEVSGRGVGMDIVQSTVSRLKGRVVIDSTPGQGSTCTIRLPLTLAIARVLLVEAHNQTFAIPLADVTQIVRRESEAIERLGETPVIRVDGQVLPVFRLGEQLGLKQPTASTGDHLPIVITQVGDKQVALVVDQLLGGREVVVKTLGSHLRRVEGVIGSTLMGDGSIVLILNPIELVGEMQRRTTPRQAQTLSPAARASEALEILIVDDAFSVRRVVANLIKSVGWRTVLAKDGVEALDIIQRAARLPDLILLDVEMPQMDGYELTSTLRAHPSYCHVPIVMLTSRSGEKHRQKAFEVGATDYLVKPYQDDILLETVRRLVPRVSGTTAA